MSLRCDLTDGKYVQRGPKSENWAEAEKDTSPWGYLIESVPAEDTGSSPFFGC